MMFNGKDIGPVKTERDLPTKTNQYSMPVNPDVYKPYQKEKINPRPESGKKQYLCDICRKSFQQVCQLKQHRRIHTGIQFYFALIFLMIYFSIMKLI